ncbi:MAG: universal stress protein [Spirochaetales bacterium]|nr:universal stress protein [Spirochaetales bacterium]
MKRILVCLDFTEISSSVVEEACSFAVKTGAALKLIYVSPYRGKASSHVVANQKDDISLKMIKENKKMEKFEHICKDKGAEVDTSILSGGVSEAICKSAREFDPNFVIIGSHTTNAATHMIKGSVGADLLKKLKIPVLLVPCRTCSED